MGSDRWDDAKLLELQQRGFVVTDKTMDQKLNKAFGIKKEDKPKRRSNEEYLLCKELAVYIRDKYPLVMFHFDLSGLNLSMVQAGMNKVIQGYRGHPDLFIYESRNLYHGLAIEVKKEGTKIFKENGDFTTPHIAEQAKVILDLKERGYSAHFGIGIEECKAIIYQYFKP